LEAEGELADEEGGGAGGEDCVGVGGSFGDAEEGLACWNGQGGHVEDEVGGGDRVEVGGEAEAGEGVVDGVWDLG